MFGKIVENMKENLDTSTINILELVLKIDPKKPLFLPFIQYITYSILK